MSENIKKPSSNIFKVLTFEGEYDGFTDFYSENKSEIYRTIIDLFNEFKNNKKKTLNLGISAKIKGLDWDTEFSFKRNESIILTRDVIPYFESLENYEICSEIIELHKDLTS
jgi:hypothetical protein